MNRADRRAQKAHNRKAEKKANKQLNGGGSRHISQLRGTDKALADQYIQFALLAIVQSQGKPVSIPLEHASDIFDTHRLNMRVEDGNIVLEAEEQESQIIKPSDMIQ